MEDNLLSYQASLLKPLFETSGRLFQVINFYFQILNPLYLLINLRFEFQGLLSSSEDLLPDS